MNSAIVLMLLAAAIGAWRLVRLIRFGRADVLVGGHGSVGKEHPFFWLHAILLVALTVGSLFLAFHFWGADPITS